MAMSKEHKEALAQGRKESRAIKSYLKALQSRKPGRPVSRETLEKRLERVQSQLTSTDDPLKSLELVQTRLEIEDRMAAMANTENLEGLEKDFVNNAKSYSDRKGITYTAWREIGVPAAVLRLAGIKETRRRR